MFIGCFLLYGCLSILALHLRRPELIVFRRRRLRLALALPPPTSTLIFGTRTMNLADNLHKHQSNYTWRVILDHLAHACEPGLPSRIATWQIPEKLDRCNLIYKNRQSARHDSHIAQIANPEAVKIMPSVCERKAIAA